MGSGALHKLNPRSLTRAVSSSNPHCPGINREPPRLSSSCHSSSLQEAVEASFAKIKTKGRRAERLSPLSPLIPTAHLLHSSQRESTPAHALLMSLWFDLSGSPLSDRASFLWLCATYPSYSHWFLPDTLNSPTSGHPWISMFWGPFLPNALTLSSHCFLDRCTTPPHEVVCSTCFSSFLY